MKRGRKSKYFSKETFENRWNVALYIRLSVQDGDKEESNSIVNQKELLNMFLEKEKELTFYNYYIDDGFTGTTFERPAFKKMMEDVELGLVNTIIVKDISRLGRNFIEMGNLVQNIFNGNNYGTVNQTNNINKVDEKIFDVTLEKLDLMRIESKLDNEKIKEIQEYCRKKDKNKVIEFLKEIATGTGTNLIATGILAMFGLV